MEVEAATPKRDREEAEETAAKRPKPDTSEQEGIPAAEAKPTSEEKPTAEDGSEHRSEATETEEKKTAEADKNGEKKDEKAVVKEAKLGPMVFKSSVEMFSYFYELLHGWVEDHDVNKYEHMVLLDLLRKGHPNPESKIGPGVQAFQVRTHPVWESRCYYLVRVDGTFDDFSYRKCVNQVMELPPGVMGPSGNMNLDLLVPKPEKRSGGNAGGHGKGGAGRGFRGARGGGGGRGGGRGRGRGRRGR